MADARQRAASTASSSTRAGSICAPSLCRACAAPRAGGPLTIVANLLRPLLLELGDTLVEIPSQLLASGLLVPEVDEVVAAFARRCGLAERERRRSGEWAAVWLSA